MHFEPLSLESVVSYDVASTIHQFLPDVHLCALHKLDRGVRHHDRDAIRRRLRGHAPGHVRLLRASWRGSTRQNSLRGHGYKRCFRAYDHVYKEASCEEAPGFHPAPRESKTENETPPRVSQGITRRSPCPGHRDTGRVPLREEAGTQAFALAQKDKARGREGGRECE
jgi:hypothetical protein